MFILLDRPVLDIVSAITEFVVLSSKIFFVPSFFENERLLYCLHWIFWYKLRWFVPNLALDTIFLTIEGKVMSSLVLHFSPNKFLYLNVFSKLMNILYNCSGDRSVVFPFLDCSDISCTSPATMHTCISICFKFSSASLKAKLLQHVSWVPCILFERPNFHSPFFP